MLSVSIITLSADSPDVPNETPALKRVRMVYGRKRGGGAKERGERSRSYLSFVHSESRPTSMTPGKKGAFSALEGEERRKRKGKGASIIGLTTFLPLLYNANHLSKRRENGLRE